MRVRVVWNRRLDKLETAVGRCDLPEDVDSNWEFDCSAAIQRVSGFEAPGPLSQASGRVWPLQLPEVGSRGSQSFFWFLLPENDEA